MLDSIGKSCHLAKHKWFWLKILFLNKYKLYSADTIIICDFYSIFLDNVTYKPALSWQNQSMTYDTWPKIYDLL